LNETIERLRRDLAAMERSSSTVVQGVAYDIRQHIEKLEREREKIDPRPFTL
jgi:hypothetical protein